jgi:hypothetical protein
MGLTGEAADKYAKDVIAADFEKPGDDDVIDKVTKDLAAKGLGISREQVRHQLSVFLAAAKKQLMGG